jgi:hypothetical protein
MKRKKGLLNKVKLVVDFCTAFLKAIQCMYMIRGHMC